MFEPSRLRRDEKYNKTVQPVRFQQEAVARMRQREGLPEVTQSAYYVWHMHVAEAFQLCCHSCMPISS